MLEYILKVRLKAMKKIYDEILKRFPEVQVDQENIELPYLMMREIVSWLNSRETDCTSPGIVKRVVDFKKWCENQESGQSAADDIWTIFTVSFFEPLFGNKKTQSLISYLTSRKEMIENNKYLISWIGKENYDAVLRNIKK